VGGAILNTLTVLIGSITGLLIGNRLPERIQTSVMTGLGLTTVMVGIGNAQATGNIIIPLISLVVGVIIGELLRIDVALERFGGWLRDRLSPKSKTTLDAETEQNERARFINGFVTASLIFCIGPLTFVGSLQDGMGLAAGFQQIAIKSVLDLFAAMAFASTLGVGVAFSAITVIVVQGGLSLLGMLAGSVMSDPMINEMTAVGGLMLLGLSLILLDIKRPRIANFLPALLIAPLIVAAASALGINLYPL
jgi:uncharacterized membrane protein YqgA involved in biofilm formation